MRWKKHTPEEITAKLERIAKALKRGVALASAAEAEGICESTYFRWRSLYGSLSPLQVQRYKQLELENARLRRLLEEFDPGQALAS